MTRALTGTPWTDNPSVQVSLVSILVFAVLVFLPEFAFARFVEDVVVSERDGGFEIRLEFSDPVELLSISPQNLARTFDLQIKPEALSTIDDLEETLQLSWNTENWSPIKDIFYDGSGRETPLINFQFTDDVLLSVRRSSSNRELIVDIELPMLSAVKAAAPVAPADAGIGELQSSDPAAQRLIDEARQAFVDKQYSRAVQLLTKLRDEHDGAESRRAQELIGVARELNGQAAQAKREYEDFIEAYPDGEDTDRVRQRLATLITAARMPRSRQRDMQSPDAWSIDTYGGFGQRYSRDETTPQDSASYIVRNELLTDFDYVLRARRQGIDLKAQLVASYKKDFEDSNENETLPNLASIEVRMKDLGLYGKFGRQTRTSGGVLGRYDGIHVAYDLGESVSINGVWGYPVIVDNKSHINTDQEFGGLSLDVINVLGGWNFTAFVIEQEYFGVTDRRAVGAEARYFDAQKSYFALVDYDTYFSELNTFLFLGNWNVTKDTRINLTADYRYSPILTVNNAIQGQGVANLDELFDVYSTDTLKTLAQDRTARSETLTVGVTHQLNDRWQFVGEVTGTRFGETQASGGVAANPATDLEVYYSGQAIANSFLFDDDILILGGRFSDATNSRNYTLTGNWRFNANRNFRVNPRLRVDLRRNKSDSGEREIYRPSIVLKYHVGKWMNLEFELGYEWYRETLDSGFEINNDSLLVTMGYRMQF